MTDQRRLHTARLTVLPLTDQHRDLEIELDTDPEVMRYLSGRAATASEMERAHQRRLVAAREVPGLGFWVGFDGAEFIGWWLLRPRMDRTSRGFRERPTLASGCFDAIGEWGTPPKARTSSSATPSPVSG